MKTKRTLLFRVGAVALLLAIGAVMMVIGRGHTVYIDSKAIEYNAQTYEAPYKAVIFVDDEQIAKLYDTERGMSVCIGQSFEMTLEITQEKGGDEEVRTLSFPLPYGMDGIAINLPALLAGLPEEAYLSEFKIVIEEPKDDEAPDGDVTGDEFGIGGDI